MRAKNVARIVRAWLRNETAQFWWSLVVVMFMMSGFIVASYVTPPGSARWLFTFNWLVGGQMILVIFAPIAAAARLKKN